MEVELTPYRTLAQKWGEVIDLELVGGYARVIIKRNNAFFVLMVQPPYVIFSLNSDVGMSEAEALELYNSFPNVLRGWKFLHWCAISAEKWGTDSPFVIGMMYVSTDDRIWIFAWRLSDGEVRFLPPKRLDEAGKVFVDFLSCNMKKVFERPNVFTPPAPEGAERRE